MLLVVAGALLTLPVVPFPGAQAASPGAFADCAAVGRPLVVVARVACQRLDSTLIGGTTAFSYYVPPACTAGLGHRCPVLYLLHGFGGDYHSMLGSGDHPSAWVAALTSAPPGTAWMKDPWDNADPSRWQARPSLDMVLVAPDGRTVAGGFGPGGGLDGYWTDWNPRFAAGGDEIRYPTPPPRFSSYLRDELIPFVEGHFAVGAGRDFRAIGGTSLGGYGSYLNGLQHPDVWTSMSSVSGAHNFLFAPGIDPVLVTSPVGIEPPVPLPHVALPGPTSAVPGGVLPAQANTFLTATTALGDPVADQAYFRGNTPTDLAMNARASANGRPSLYIDGFVNDMIPRRSQDIADMPFEVIVFPMNIDMEAAFASQSAPNDFAIHPGVHSDPYRNAWLRGIEDNQYARLRHWDGSGDPTPAPTLFDYRTIALDSTIWGWELHVQRPNVEFLQLRTVSCNGLSLQGTGRITVTIPKKCHTGLDGRRTFTTDLGSSFAVDDPVGLGATPVYGRTAMIHLRPLAHA